MSPEIITRVPIYRSYNQTGSKVELMGRSLSKKSPKQPKVAKNLFSFTISNCFQQNVIKISPKLISKPENLFRIPQILVRCNFELKLGGDLGLGLVSQISVHVLVSRFDYSLYFKQTKYIKKT
jgi:hypothetical protein